MPKIHFIIPAFNEEKTIKEIIFKIKEKNPNYKITVVDDGSSDNTYSTAKEAADKVYSHLINLGQWASLKTGFKSVLDNKPDIIVTLDGDGQHDPAEVEKLIRPIINNEADLVIGSRFILEKTPEMKTHRRFGINIFNEILKIATGLRISDCTSGYKAMKTEIIENSINLLSENQYGAIEFLMCLNAQGYRITEVPITNITSEQSSKGTIKYGINLLRTILNSRYW